MNGFTVPSWDSGDLWPAGLVCNQVTREPSPNTAGSPKASLAHGAGGCASRSPAASGGKLVSERHAPFDDCSSPVHSAMFEGLSCPHLEGAHNDRPPGLPPGTAVSQPQSPWSSHSRLPLRAAIPIPSALSRQPGGHPVTHPPGLPQPQGDGTQTPQLTSGVTPRAPNTTVPSVV